MNDENLILVIRECHIRFVFLFLFGSESFNDLSGCLLYTSVTNCITKKRFRTYDVRYSYFMTSCRATTLFVLIASVSVSGAQAPSQPEIHRLDKHGTCATAIVAPFGAAFIIDSRITASDRDGHVVSQYPGCKVLLARPTILLAGVGVEDTTGRAGHWNSLDEAAAALKRLPENPTKEQLTKWSDDWGRSLWNHYRQGEKLRRPRQPFRYQSYCSSLGSGRSFTYIGREWCGMALGLRQRLRQGKRIQNTHRSSIRDCVVNSQAIVIGKTTRYQRRIVAREKSED